MFDTNLMLSTDIQMVTGQGSSIDYGQGGMVKELNFWMIVPATGTTLDVIIETSDASDHSVVQDTFTFPQIDAAGVYHIAVRTPHRYIRYNATVVGDFGHVVLGPRMQGEYNQY